MVAFVLFVVWLFVPLALLYVALRRRAGRARLPWLVGFGSYVVLLMIVPSILVTYPRGGGDGTPKVFCTSSEGRPMPCP